MTQTSQQNGKIDSKNLTQRDFANIITLAKRRGLSNENDYTTIAALNNVLFKGESSITAIFNHDLTLYSQFIGTYVLRNQNDMGTWIDTNGKLHSRNDLDELGKVTAETPEVAEIIKKEGITWGMDFSHQSVLPMDPTSNQEGIEMAEMMLNKPWPEIHKEIIQKTEILNTARNVYQTRGVNDFVCRTMRNF